MLTVSEYRELYEGLTQEDSAFRERLAALAGPSVCPDKILSDLELAENRLVHAMLGVHPIYRREVELSGIVDYEQQVLRLYVPKGETNQAFSELDPAYVSFLEAQKRIYNVKKQLPLSSVALKASAEWLQEEGVSAPSVDEAAIHLPKESFGLSRRVLEAAFAKNVILVNHIQEEIEKHGLAEAYGANREELHSYCQSHSFDYAFDKSVTELGVVANEALKVDDV